MIIYWIIILPTHYKIVKTIHVHTHNYACQVSSWRYNLMNENILGLVSTGQSSALKPHLDI